MCRRYILAFCVCLSLLVSFSFCLADDSTSIDGDYIFDQEPYEVFGFEDEQSFVDFLVFISEFPGGDNEALAEYYNSSVYASMGHSVDHLRTLYDFIQDNGVEPLAVGSEWSIAAGSLYGPTTNSITFSNNSYSGATTYITFTDIPRTSYGPNGYRYQVSLADLATTTYVDQVIAQAAGAWDSSTVSDLMLILGKSDWLNNATGSIFSYLRHIASSAAYYFPEAHSIPTYFYLPASNSTTSSSYPAISDILANTSNTLYYSLARGNDQYRAFAYNETPSSYVANSRSISQILSDIANTQYLSLSAAGNYLHPDGSVSPAPRNRSISTFLRDGFVGLNLNVETALVGFHGHTAIIDLLTFDENLDPVVPAEGEELPTVNNLLDAITTLGLAIQRPVSQLQAVLANDDDLELRRQTQEQVEAITDDFTGDGGAAPSVDNIKDAAGISTSISGTFETGVSVSDGFGILQSEDSFSFFSQAVSDDLNGTGIAPAAEDDSLDAYEFDDNGFAVLKDQSEFSISDFLGRDLK